MTGILHFVWLTLRARRRRILGLAAFGTLFLAAGVTARFVSGRDHGHLELDALFELGGTTLVSALLLLAWLIGRFGIIAALVLVSGIFAEDRAAGQARLYAVRPRSMTLLYAARFVVLTATAFVMTALLMPLFDWIVLGQWIGTSAFILIAAQVLLFASITAVLSLVTRADAWLALFLGLLALVWDALRRADILAGAAPLVRETVSVVLPPQGALLRIEAAFGAMEPIPADAFLYIVTYCALVLLLAGVALGRREV